MYLKTAIIFFDHGKNLINCDPPWKKFRNRTDVLKPRNVLIALSGMNTLVSPLDSQLKVIKLNYVRKSFH